MKVEDKLFLVRFKPDTQSHLSVKDADVCLKCENKDCVKFCPAEVYEWDKEHKTLLIAYEGCLECGTCRIGCPYLNIKWEYPRGGFGVQFKFG